MYVYLGIQQSETVIINLMPAFERWSIYCLHGIFVRYMLEHERQEDPVDSCERYIG